MEHRLTQVSFHNKIEIKTVTAFRTTTQSILKYLFSMTFLGEIFDTFCMKYKHLSVAF